MADLVSKLDEIVEQITNARAMPLSASCVINRSEMLDQLEELRALFPPEVQAAKEVMDGREGVLEEARVEAAAIITDARAERTKLIAKTEIAQAASLEAVTLVEEAREIGDAMRREVDDYVDAKLANFEVVLQKTLAAVDRGREKMRGRSELDDLAAVDNTPLLGSD